MKRMEGEERGRKDVSGMRARFPNPARQLGTAHLLHASGSVPGSRVRGRPAPCLGQWTTSIDCYDFVSRRRFLRPDISVLHWRPPMTSTENVCMYVCVCTEKVCMHEYVWRCMYVYVCMRARYDTIPAPISLQQRTRDQAPGVRQGAHGSHETIIRQARPEQGDENVFPKGSRLLAFIVPAARE